MHQRSPPSSHHNRKPGKPCKQPSRARSRPTATCQRPPATNEETICSRLLSEREGVGRTRDMLLFSIYSKTPVCYIGTKIYAWDHRLSVHHFFVYE